MMLPGELKKAQAKEEALKKVLSHKALKLGTETGVTAEFIVQSTSEQLASNWRTYSCSSTRSRKCYIPTTLQSTKLRRAAANAVADPSAGDQGRAKKKKKKGRQVRPRERIASCTKRVF